MHVFSKMKEVYYRNKHFVFEKRSEHKFFKKTQISLRTQTRIPTTFKYLMNTMVLSIKITSKYSRWMAK